MPNFLTGLSRIVGSAKLQTAVYTTVGAFFAVRYASPSIPPDQKAILWGTFMVAIIGLFGVVIHGWSTEDAATNAQPAQPPAQPSTQVNVGDHATGVQQPTGEPLHFQVQSQPKAQPTMRSINIPPRVQSIIFILIIPLLMLAGCQSQVEYVTFREGLAAVDYPLYQQHEQLIDDAVKSGLRTPADAATVHAETAAARQLYDKSRKDVPTTQGSIFGQ